MLTASKLATTGYWIPALKMNVFSLEEINYFIYHHIDLVYRDFFCEELFDYMEKELEEPDMAEELRRIDRRGGNTGDFVRHILNSSYYYSGRELAEIWPLVAGIDSMGKAERIKIQADSSYREGNYNSALKGYLGILKDRGSEDLSDSFYGRVAYAVGSIYARLFMGKSANTFFSYAYDLSPDPMYARACVYMSILTDDDEELLSSIVKFKITDDALDSIRQRVKATRRELENSDEMGAFLAEMESEDFASGVVENWKSEYYEMLK